ncbi:MAG: hypothetical protein HDKAJFGB_03642 [Anaerolineae bacterium]|nr:hypothetical protein [Anaerolineae bacterium]
MIQTVVAVRIRLVKVWIIDAGEFVRDDGGGETEPQIDRAHPARADARQIIVRRDQMHAASGERVEIQRQRGDQRFAFARPHFRNLAVVQNDARHQLHVEVALPVRAARRFAHGGKRFRQKFVERRLFVVEQFLFAVLHLELERFAFFFLGGVEPAFA